MYTLSYFQEILDYNKDTGIFVWKITQGKAIKGNIAGSKNSFTGHIYICFNGKKFLAHRLAWLFVNGCFPDQCIDHINGIKDDNKISNLRAVSSKVNAENIRKAHKDSKTGYLGVGVKKKKYAAQIMSNGKKYVLGCFSTPEEAHEAYLIAKRKLHEGCTI